MAKKSLDKMTKLELVAQVRKYEDALIEISSRISVDEISRLQSDEYFAKHQSDVYPHLIGFVQAVCDIALDRDL